MKSVDILTGRLSSAINDYCAGLSDLARREEKPLKQLVADEHIDWQLDTSYETLSEKIKSVADRIRQAAKATVSKEEGEIVKEKEEKTKEEYAITWNRLEEKRPAVCRWVFSRIQRRVCNEKI